MVRQCRERQAEDEPERGTMSTLQTNLDSQAMEREAAAGTQQLRQMEMEAGAFQASATYRRVAEAVAVEETTPSFVCVSLSLCLCVLPFSSFF